MVCTSKDVFSSKYEKITRQDDQANFLNYHIISWLSGQRKNIKSLVSPFVVLVYP